MLDSDRIWAIALGSAAFALCIGIPSCSIHADRAIAEMVKAGADPIAAHCAVTSSSDRVMCAAYVSATAGRSQ